MSIQEGQKTGFNGKHLDTAALTPASLTLLASPKNLLAKKVEDIIVAEGPITFNRLMEPWLDSFYSNVVIGNNDGRLPDESSDFLTPPEYTPIFGFCMAKQILELWESMDMPEDFRVVEMGAGNGTLAHDILYGLRHYHQEKKYEKDPGRSIRYTIIEKNPTLLAKQKRRLAAFSQQADLIHASATSFPLEDITGVFISSELPDAFPVHLVRKNENDWEELFVGLGDEEQFEKSWRKPHVEVSKFINDFEPDLEEGKIYPVNIDATRWMNQIGRSLKKGYVITIDYDYTPENRENIRTMAAGRERLSGMDAIDGCFLKANFGKTDITTDVDFQVLAAAGRMNGLNSLGYVSLAGFLFGLSFDHDLYNFSTHFPDNLIGDRIHDYGLSRRLYERDASFWNVLVQSKGINANRGICGLQFVFNDDRDSGTSEAEREKFRSIKI